MMFWFCVTAQAQFRQLPLIPSMFLWQSAGLIQRWCRARKGQISPRAPICNDSELEGTLGYCLQGRSGLYSVLHTQWYVHVYRHEHKTRHPSAQHSSQPVSMGTGQDPSPPPSDHCGPWPVSGWDLGAILILPPAKPTWMRLACYRPRWVDPVRGGHGLPQKQGAVNKKKMGKNETRG
jgi:hypothetical protein